MPDTSLAFDADLCAAAADAYKMAATFVAGGDVRAVLTRRGDLTIVAFRGTLPGSWNDWFRDMAAWPDDDHPVLGPCHTGFVTGAECMLQLLRGALTGKPFAVTGHSLGGALAIASTALLADCGLRAVRCTTFGAPRVGMAPLAEILKPIEGRRFRFGDDPVPEVPCWPYQTDRGWTRVGEPALNPITDHAVSGYLKALAPVAVAA